MNEIYCDNAATTPVLEEVFEAMTPYLRGAFGNASSLHFFGREAKFALDRAREIVAGAIHARPDEIIFTGGGSEANNLALVGTAQRFANGGLAVSAVEHPSVLNTATRLEKTDRSVLKIPVDQDGVVSLEAFSETISSNIALASVMSVNNETGVIQPLQELSEMAAEKRVFFHTDAVQALGKLPIDVRKFPASMMSFSAHKLHGPKGVGALFLRRGVKLSPLITGGAQENGRRAGTENVAGIVGFAKAVEIALREMQNDEKVVARISEFQRFMVAEMPVAKLNGGDAKKSPYICNYSFPGLESEALVMKLDLHDVAVSNGSACSSGKVEISHVLQAMNLPKPRQNSAVRFSFSRLTTEDDIERLKSVLLKVITPKLKRAR